MKTFKITVFLSDIVGDDTDEESFRETVKEALLVACDLDDSGEEDLEFIAEEIEEDF
jgi:hypothetical protein